MKKTILRKYASLIATCGAAVQKGQEVFISAGLDQPDFVRMLVEECYKLGASRVVVDWDYQPLTRTHLHYCGKKVLGTMPDYEQARWQHYTETFPCRIYLESEDPDGLKGVSREKLAYFLQKRRALQKPYRNKLENNYQWCIAGVPGEKWAKKLFPSLSRKQAVEALWKAILAAARVDDDPKAAWARHNQDLSDRCNWLNSLGIEKLHYTSQNGTDFTVGLISRSSFCGGGETTRQGIFFNPNLPTEECFVSPEKGVAEGIVYATKPLSYAGQLIENFSIRFHEGKAVEWHAEKGENLLTEIITTDEGSCYLGECALVPYDSPIQNSGLLFYSTLFDENAACHLALGMGFAETLQNFQELSLEEVHALGVNDSTTHVDFMIGSEDMNIDAICKDGRVVPVFRNGNWAVQ